MVPDGRGVLSEGEGEAELEDVPLLAAEQTVG